MDKTQKPLVSICCITYNHEKYIRDAIESFLMQKTDFSFEIIIHDDASTDRTADIIREYEKKYPDVIKPIYQTENQYSKGVNVAFITFKKAKGRYIAFCEGDDYWIDPLKLQTQVTFLEKNSDYVITYTDVKAFDENGNIDTYVGGALKDLNEKELKRTTPINTLTTCFRNVIKEFPSELSIAKIGDLTIWSLLGAYGKGKFIGEIKPSAYRIHDNGVFSKKSQTEKMYMIFTTRISLMLYYMRIGDVITANYFMRQVTRDLFRYIGILQTIEVFLLYLFAGIFRYLKDK
jgi:glycosyltransferase involved in cell wall biosynthesis